MPLHVLPADVARFSLSGTFDTTGRWANVFHVRADGIDASDMTQVADLCDDLVGAFHDSQFYLQCSDTFTALVAKISVSDGSAFHDYAQAVTTIVGAESGARSVGANACVVSWLGAWHYRGGKPRTYIGGLTDAWTGGATFLDNGHVVTQRTKAANLLSAIEALSGTYGSDVQLGAVIGNTAGSAGTWYPFTGSKVTGQVGSQRRRNRA